MQLVMIVSGGPSGLLGDQSSPEVMSGSRGVGGEMGRWTGGHCHQKAADVAAGPRRVGLGVLAISWVQIVILVLPRPCIAPHTWPLVPTELRECLKL